MAKHNSVQAASKFQLLGHCVPLVFRWLLLVAGIAIACTTQALPSFARQTGVACSACHVGGFGPQLTPFGREFKLGGYTLKTTQKPVIPISAMMVGIYDQTAKDLPEEVVDPHFSANHNSVLQETSLFLAGAVNSHIGGLMQVTYSGVDRVAAMDNLDIRYANQTQIFGKEATLGLTINNNPTNQDPWNTTPAWGFPYMLADLAPEAGGAPLIDGGLEQQVLGLTSYIYLENKIYAELGFYKTQSTSLLERTQVVESADDVSKISGAAPYWRLAYSDYFGGQNISLGLFGISADILPGAQAGPSDKYRDIGLDASYQYMASANHLFTLNGRWVNEKQTLDASLADGAAERSDNKTTEININGSYYYQNTYGLTLGYFNNRGSRQDFTLFSADPLEGSRLGHSDSAGAMIQLDFTPFGKPDSWHQPWANIRLGLQYIDYQKVNGASSNYDGFGRNASDNNTLMLMIWASI